MKTIAGTISATVNLVIQSPFERTRIMRLTSPDLYGKGIAESVRIMYAKGMYTYYKKMDVRRFEVAIPIGSQFPIYDFYKTQIMRNPFFHHATIQDEVNAFGKYLGGFLTGTTIAVFIYPMDSMRIKRMCTKYIDAYVRRRQMPKDFEKKFGKMARLHGALFTSAAFGYTISLKLASYD